MFQASILELLHSLDLMLWQKLNLQITFYGCLPEETGLTPSGKDFPSIVSK